MCIQIALLAGDCREIDGSSHAADGERSNTKTTLKHTHTHTPREEKEICVGVAFPSERGHLVSVAQVPSSHPPRQRKAAMSHSLRITGFTRGPSEIIVS